MIATRKIRIRTVALPIAASAGLLVGCGADDSTENDDTTDTADDASPSGEDATTPPTVYEPVIDLGTEPFVLDLTGIEEPLAKNWENTTFDPSEPSVTGVRIYFDLGYPDAGWRLAMSNSGSTSWRKAGNQWTVAAADFGGDPIAVCEAALSYLRPFDEDARVVIALEDPDAVDETSETPVAQADTGEGCSRV